MPTTDATVRFRVRLLVLSEHKVGDERLAASSADERSVADRGVRGQNVSLQFRRKPESFRTLVASVRFFTGVQAPVSGERSGLRESQSAEVAHVRLLAGVYPLVEHVRVVESESLAAQLAQVGHLRRVDAPMPHQVLPVGEPPTARLAYVGLGAAVRVGVVVHALGTAKQPAAHRALVPFGSTTHVVLSPMLRQVLRVAEATSAYLANVRFGASVRGQVIRQAGARRKSSITSWTWKGFQQPVAVDNLMLLEDRFFGKRLRACRTLIFTGFVDAVCNAVTVQRPLAFESQTANIA